MLVLYLRDHYFKIMYSYIWGLYGSSVSKESACNVGDLGSIHMLLLQNPYITNFVEIACIYILTIHVNKMYI